MSQVVDQWRILVRKDLMYVRDPYATGNFWTSCATPRFSGTIVVCRVICLHHVNYLRNTV